MNTVSRTITGTIGITLGFLLLVVGIFLPFTLIYAIPLLIIGFFIIFNTKEDDIEKVKHKRERRKK